MTHQHTCPRCRHKWDCFGVWSDKAKVKTAETCDVTLGLKTNGGLCILCYHVGMADNCAQMRFSNKSKPLAYAVERYLKRSSSK